MIVALLNQRRGVGNTTLALHLAGLWACQTRHVTVIDADPQGRALEWSELRAQERLPRRITATCTRSMPVRLHQRSPTLIRRY